MDSFALPHALMIAYHFPPQKGSSGIQRTLRFCRHLPSFGWRPMVLTVDPRAYDEISDDLMAGVPDDVPVVRAFACNAARAFSLRGRYPWFTAVPDRWSSWIVTGTWAGLRMIRKHRPSVIWSTYPIASAHVIGYLLHRLSGIPWVADFRDPMAQDGYPADPRIWKSFKRIEEKALRWASRCLFTSPSAIRDYRRTYPDVPPEKLVLLENGYDEETLASASDARTVDTYETKGRLLLLHSGIVYTHERDPTELFSALGELKRCGEISAQQLEIRFRASANDTFLAALAQKHDVEDIVALAPPIPYAAALAEMFSADALLVMQASNSNSQIPAKLYEYLRVGRPLLALTDEKGDTADLIRRAGLKEIAPLDSARRIIAMLPAFLARLRANEIGLPNPDFVRRCSRRARTEELAALFDCIKQG